MTNPGRPMAPPSIHAICWSSEPGPGLGGAIAHRFTQGGYHVTLLVRRADGLAKLASDLADAGYVLPLRLRGGTGSPVNPVALF